LISLKHPLLSILASNRNRRDQTSPSEWLVLGQFECGSPKMGLAGSAKERILSTMTEEQRKADDEPAGWLIRLTFDGNPPLQQFFQVYISDRFEATKLIKAQYASANDLCEAVKPLNSREFTGQEMKLGEIKQRQGV
jgi:hypothetical protein